MEPRLGGAVLLAGTFSSRAAAVRAGARAPIPGTPSEVEIVDGIKEGAVVAAPVEGQELRDGASVAAER